MQTPTFTCPTCDATITERPVFFVGLAFCCAGCAASGPCMCSYDPPEDCPAEDIPVVTAEAIPGGRATSSPVSTALGVTQRVLVAIDA